MKKYFLLLLFVSGLGFSQSISEYKYAIIPSKFNAQKKPGQFDLNKLTKLFLEKNGYTAFFDTDILPPEVSGESCNKIYVDVFDDNSIRTTKLNVVIKDCRNAVLFTSDYGTSTDKDNNVAYNRALRAAFGSFDKPEYHYNPSARKTIPVSTKETAPVKTVAEIKGDLLEEDHMPAPVMVYAQPIADGYQLVNAEPKVVLKIYTTTEQNLFIAADPEGNTGMLIRKGTEWLFEYHAPSGLQRRSYQIKF